MVLMDRGLVGTSPSFRRYTADGAALKAFKGLPVHSSVNSFAKRAIDVAGALVGLLLLAIIFIPVAVAIRIDSPGPIFFAQERVGLRGQRIRIRKFRSMVVDAERRRSEVANEAKGPIFKNQNDPRITCVGRFLRKTSLDEFPQFWNVLVGDMSLVGTRPPTPEEVTRYSKRHWRRLNVRPGLTGEWQVNGRSTVKDFDAIVAMDLEYQAKWTVSYDLELIHQTIVALLIKRIGAY